MSYIGNTIQNQSYAPAVDFFNGDGSTTAFTLSRPVYSTPMVQVVISNVPQNPGSAYTINGNTITFTSAPPAGTANIYVYYTSPNTTVAVLPQSPVISGDLTTTGGHYAIGAFNSGYTDGIVMDYTTGTGRITVGGSDGVSFYNGTPSARSFLFGSDSSGNVGIGTSSPSYKLHVVGSAGTVAKFTDNTNGSFLFNFASSQSSILDGGNNNLWVYDNSGQNSKFYTSNTERMRIDSSGNLLFNSGYGSVATAYGCRAWVNFNGTNNSIRASGNVSSISDPGIGQPNSYWVNFTNAMPDANYAISSIGIHSPGATEGPVDFVNQSGITTAHFLIQYRGNGTNAAQAYMFAAVFR